MINNSFICKFFKDFTNHRKKTNRTVVFICRPFHNILKYRDRRWNLPAIWKTRLLQTVIDEFSYEFFRTTTGIQSRPDAFDKSRFAITFPTILGVTETSCSPRLAPGGKTGNDILSHQFLEKFSANNFALTDAEENTFRPLIRGSIIADLPLLRTLLAICQNSWEPSFSKVMDSLVLLAYASLAASRTLGQQLLACPNFTLDSEDLFYWYKQKSWFQWIMAAAQTAENHADEWGLTWYLRWGIYTSIPMWTTHKIYQ